MVEVTIDSVRVSLMSQHRIVVLKETDSTRFLPIWIGPFEADAITIQLQSVEVARPLTHDLLKSAIEQLGAEIVQVSITDLRNDTFYAEIALRVNGRQLAVDSRPSDAIALAVRAPRAGLCRRRSHGAGRHHARRRPRGDGSRIGRGPRSGADVAEAFREFLEGLDLSGLE